MENELFGCVRSLLQHSDEAFDSAILSRNFLAPKKSARGTGFFSVNTRSQEAQLNNENTSRRRQTPPSEIIRSRRLVARRTVCRLERRKRAEKADTSVFLLLAVGFLSTDCFMMHRHPVSLSLLPPSSVHPLMCLSPRNRSTQCGTLRIRDLIKCAHIYCYDVHILI